LGKYRLLLYLVQYSESESNSQEAGLHLIRKPKRPKWRPFIQVNSTARHDSWKHFIDLAH
jgi:hypothetical protein